MMKEPNKPSSKYASAVHFTCINFEMDKKEHHFHSLDICNRLYSFIMKILSTHGSKTVTLGCPPLQNLGKAQNGAIYESDQKLQPTAQEANNMKSSESLALFGSSSNDHKQDGKALAAVQDKDECPEIKPQEEEPPQAKPHKIKKNVSINERVEEINTGWTKMKRKKSTEKMPSIDLDDDTIQPLKSILKRDSGFDERSHSLIHCNSD